MNEALLYIGSAIAIVWGIAHLVPTRNIVNGFGDISEDNKKIIAMESIAEGITLIFVGFLPLLVTLLADWQDDAARIVYLACGGMLLTMALLTMATGARTALLPYRICPAVKTLAAVLLILGATL